jgi:MFS family permease
MTTEHDMAERIEPAGGTGMRWALASVALSTVLSSLATSIANVALPTFVDVFHVSIQQAQWVVLSYLIAVTALVVSVGRMGDVIGRRRLLLAGVLVFTAASALCGLAPTFAWLVVARALQGAGAAVMMSLAIAFVEDIVPRSATGSAMGLLGTMSAIGTALGPSLGGVLISTFGWQATFLVCVPLGILTFALSMTYLPADELSARSRAGRSGVHATLSVARGLLRDTALSGALATNVLVMTVLMTTLVVGPFYLTQALHLEPAVVGAVMAAGPIVAALTGVPAGRAVDRLGTWRIGVSGLAAIAIGSIALAMTSTGFGIAGYMAPLVVITAGFASFQAANNTAVMKGAPGDKRGLVSGMLNLSRNIGLITGTGGMGAIFAVNASVNGAAAGMRLTFLVAAILIALGIAIAFGTHHRVIPSRPHSKGPSPSPL